MIVYHGTDEESARSIYDQGIDREKCAGGYFGRGFYVTSEPMLALCNHGNSMVAFRIPDDAACSFEVFENAAKSFLISNPDFDLRMSSMGIHAIADASMGEGGLCVYSYDILEPIALIVDRRVLERKSGFNEQQFDAEIALKSLIRKCLKGSRSEIAKTLAAELPKLSPHLTSLKRYFDYENTLEDLRYEDPYIHSCLAPVLVSELEKIEAPPRRVMR